ncbi:uncharacterized protein LOC119568621 [Penaeus monodon]|uniref:uncharacterized protein LOC119568621 n=1 Tax=Penaeus monodon TaxID=6687 RepID=UPI0018A78C67|nr:uncharacterized protein LOC119568621 [Penaeus monodon]
MKCLRFICEVCRFLGACGFFRRCVQGFVNVVHPLTQLAKKGVTFTWSPEAEKAFQDLKAALVSAPVLRLPDFERHFEIHTNASAQAFDAVLIQHSDNGEPQAASYWSRILKDAESCYPAIDLEALLLYKNLAQKIMSLSCCQDLLQTLCHAHQMRALLLMIFSEHSCQPCHTRLYTPLQEFELDDGVLYHLKSLPALIIRQVCVPHSLQSQALHLAHDHPTAAHPGALCTYHNLQNTYFPNMFRLCKWYVQHCTVCQHRKGSCEVPRCSVGLHPVASLELVSPGLLDFRASVGCYRYILSIADYHSRFLQFVPLRNKTIETVLHGFYNPFITLLGPPKQILTGNGGEESA